MKTSELMSSPVHVVSVHDTLNSAAQIMWEHDCGAIPVVDDGGSLVGIVTDRDICMAAYTQGRPLAEIPVASAMAQMVFSVSGDESIDRVEQLMSEKQVRRVPVVDGQNRPVGLLSMNDLARDATRNGSTRNGMKVVATLAAVCGPRSSSVRAA